MGSRNGAALVLLVGCGCASLGDVRQESYERVAGQVEVRLQGENAFLFEADVDWTEEDVAARLADGLELSEVVELALRNQPAVRAELAELGIAAADVVQAGLLSNPLVAADAIFFDAGTEVELSLVQPLVDLFRRGRNRRVAREMLAASEARALKEIVRTAYDARRAVLEVQASRRLRDAVGEIARAEEAAEDLMRELHAAGNVERGALSRQEVATAAAWTALADSELLLYEASETLNQLMGLTGAPDRWALAGELPEGFEPWPDVDFEQVALHSSFDRMVSKATVRELAARAGGERAEVWMEAEAGVAYRREPSGETAIGPSLSAPIPLFDTGATRKRAAELRVQQARRRTESLDLAVRSAARRLAERVRATEARATFIRDVEMPASGRLVEDTLRQYNAMQVGAFDVLDAKARELDTVRRLIAAQRAALVARADLDELLAGNLNMSRVLDSRFATSAGAESNRERSNSSMGGH